MVDTDAEVILSVVDHILERGVDIARTHVAAVGVDGDPLVARRAHGHGGRLAARTNPLVNRTPLRVEPLERGPVAIDGRSLYVADTNNHVIRVVDLDTDSVSTGGGGAHDVTDPASPGAPRPVPIWSTTS